MLRGGCESQAWKNGFRIALKQGLAPVQPCWRSDQRRHRPRQTGPATAAPIHLYRPQLHCAAECECILGVFVTKPTSVERRLAAIFAADVEGYARLTHADEFGTLQALADQRRIMDGLIAKYGGRIANTAGDSVLSEFSSSSDAVLCAVEAQRALTEAAEKVPSNRRVLFRIGIHFGDVTEQGTDLLGKGVNIAARLQAIAPAGGVVISGAAYDQIGDRLSLNFRNLGARTLRNIGETVQAYSVSRMGEVAQSAVLPILAEGKQLPAPDKPIIVVSPFQNIGGGQHEHFAEGIIEDITTALSRFKSLFVLSRKAAPIDRGQQIDTGQIVRERGVRYILEGSVRIVDRRVRVASQLLEAATGLHLWADKFDGKIDDEFDFQDRVTSRLVGIVAPRIGKAEIERAARKTGEDLQAYDYYLRGLASHEQGTVAENEAALEVFRRAVDIDPNLAAASAYLALCYVHRQTQGWMTDPEKEAAEAMRLARRAVEIEKDDAVVLAASGFALLMLGDADVGVALLERALQLNPNEANAWRWGGWARIFLGDQNSAIEHFLKAHYLNPLDSNILMTFSGLAVALFLVSRYEEARTWAERALADNANWLPSLRIMVAIQAVLGQTDEAQRTTARIICINPTEKISNIPVIRYLRKYDQRRKYAESLERGGLPP